MWEKCSANFNLEDLVILRKFRAWRMALGLHS